MGIEIERKFLLLNDTWRAQVERSLALRQGYLAASAASSVRIRIEGDEARLNIKSATLGITREEFEYTIPMSDAEHMLAHLCGGKTIEKTRHFVHHDGHLWEIDEFHGNNQGLVVAELELERPDQAFARPRWLGSEVSSDPRYYNSVLIEHPYCAW